MIKKKYVIPTVLGLALLFILFTVSAENAWFQWKKPSGAVCSTDQKGVVTEGSTTVSQTFSSSRPSGCCDIAGGYITVSFCTDAGCTGSVNAYLCTQCDVGCPACQTCSGTSCVNICQGISTNCGCTSCVNCDAQGTGGGRTGDGCVGTSYVDYFCSGTSCTYASTPNDARCCLNECSASGVRQCSGTGYQTCGNYDADPCLEWSSVTSCGSGETCVSGQCCIQECSRGATHCSSSTTFQTCDNYDSDPCYEFGGTINNCPSGQVCSGGTCITVPEICTSPGDENNNNECDYDSSVCSKGDSACPVEITAISVSSTTPTEGSSIRVNCTSTVANVNSVDASIDGVGICSFEFWVGNIAIFSCNSLGSPGSKTVRCAVNTARSYKDGTDKTVVITVQATPCSAYSTESSCPSATCDWCPECVGAKYTGDVGRCVSDGSCPTAICTKDHCGATCDETQGGCTSPSTCDSGSCTCVTLGGVTHLECGIDGTCVQVTGEGSNQCSPVGSECSVPESNHAQCIGNMCVVRPGDAVDGCDSNSDCQGTPCQGGVCPDNFVCDSVNNICVCPDGTGLCNDNTCDSDCSDNGGNKGCTTTTCKVNSSCINDICQPCILYAAAWTGGNVTNCDGDICAVANNSFVELYANGTDACENKKFKFRVFEGAKSNVKAYPSSSVFDDGKVESEWIAASEDSSSASYKFYVRGVGMDDEISANTIAICMEDGKPDSDCDNIPDGEDQCINTAYADRDAVQTTGSCKGCTTSQCECVNQIICDDQAHPELKWGECDSSGYRIRQICVNPSDDPNTCCDRQDTCLCELGDCTGHSNWIPYISQCLVEEEFPFFTTFNILMVVSLLLIFYVFRFRKR